jgi:hypothetical protein
MTSKQPKGSGMSVDVAETVDIEIRRELMRGHMDIMRRVHKAMRLLEKHCFVYHACIKMWAAGHSFGHMANQLQCQKPKAAEMFECGVTWLMLWIAVNPVLRDEVPILSGRKPRAMRPSDIGL